MDLMDAIKERHSVRRYLDRPIELEKVMELRSLAEEINQKTGLHFQLQVDEPMGFSGLMAHYGSFRNVKNYFVLAGPEKMDREIGYYGEKIVLVAQMMGLRTCWVAASFNKRKAVCDLSDGEKMYVVISVGYGETDGKPHKSKAIEKVADINSDSPDWFIKGVEAALLAPTAVNQQRFFFSCRDGKVSARAGNGFYTQMDLGIAQYHFDVAAEKSLFA